MGSKILGERSKGGLTRITVSRLALGMKATFAPATVMPQEVIIHSRIRSSKRGASTYMLRLVGWPHSEEIHGRKSVWVQQEVSNINEPK
ncbi:hypothetical protein [Neptunomonas sp.]|uniref:hypothetical protein n=1 Tax=Neptunomonas sp. TaxID=1971898 RepID=UPI003566637D